MNQNEWHKDVQEWVLKNANPLGTPENNNGWVCKECEVELQGREKTASLHMKGSLAGFGEVVRLIEPFCPKCGKCYGVPPFLDHGGSRDIF